MYDSIAIVYRSNNLPFSDIGYNYVLDIFGNRHQSTIAGSKFIYYHRAIYVVRGYPLNLLHKHLGIPSILFTDDFTIFPLRKEDVVTRNFYKFIDIKTVSFGYTDWVLHGDFSKTALSNPDMDDIARLFCDVGPVMHSHDNVYFVDSRFYDMQKSAGLHVFA